jgi:hypothetical protein
MKKNRQKAKRELQITVDQALELLRLFSSLGPDDRAEIRKIMTSKTQNREKRTAARSSAPPPPTPK